MSRPRGGIIGAADRPTADIASGVWSINEWESVTREILRAQSVDPYYSQVSLLLHMDGSGTSFTDSSPSPKTVTSVGSASQSSTQFKFGGGSLEGGSGKYLSVNGGSSFNFGTGDFTVECFAYPTSTPNGSGLIANSYADDNIVGFALAFSQPNTLGSGTGSSLFFGWYNNGWLGISTSVSLTLNSWNHVAVTRNNGTARLFLNGSQVGGSLSTPQLPDMDTLWIGRKWDDSQVTPNFSGYIDEVRITKGTSRFTGSYSVPFTRFPDA
jgi:hypothetical protein